MVRNRQRKPGSGSKRPPPLDADQTFRPHDWSKIFGVSWPAALQCIIATLFVRKNQIMNADELPCYSRITQINQVFIKNNLNFRLRIHRPRSKRGDRGYRDWSYGATVRLWKTQ